MPGLGGPPAAMCSVNVSTHSLATHTASLVLACTFKFHRYSAGAHAGQTSTISQPIVEASMSDVLSILHSMLA